MSKNQVSTSGDDQTFESVKSDISTTTRDSQQQHRSESSCSNSLSVNPPVSFPTRKFPEISIETVGKSSACSDISDSFNCTSKTVENLRSRDEHDDREILGKFDLNEDIYLNETGDLIRPVAKIGIPRGQPVFPLEFEGRLGWMGPAETSAFRPVPIFSKNSSMKEPRCCFTGFDLNVAAVDDTGPHLPSRDGVDLKRADNLFIDLNRLYDAGDEYTQLPVPVEPEKFSRLLDLNLGKQDTSPMQSLANNTNSPFQPTLSFLPRTFLPPQTHHFGPMPYFPGLFNEQRSSHVKTEGKSSSETRQFLFLGNNFSSDGRLQKDEWFGPSMKRKEPERGSERYEFGYRQMI